MFDVPLLKFFPDEHPHIKVQTVNNAKTITNTFFERGSIGMFDKIESDFLRVFVKSAVITISAISLILIGYFTAGFLSGGL